MLPALGRLRWEVGATTELLPCPFCGGKAKIRTTEYFDGANTFFGYCTVCSVAAPTRIRTDEAIAAWNRRAKPDAAPVVRCKECEHYNTTGFPALNPGTGWCDKMDRGTHDDFYCSYGAKMEDKP